MEETGYDAIAKVTMHGREHIVIIRPTEQGLVLHTMYFENELHKANEIKSGSKNVKFAAKEMALAKQLINTLAAPFNPSEFEDSYRKNVERLIQQKRKGREVTEIKQPEKPQVVDIMEALKRSLASKKAPEKPRAKGARKSA